jgi:hypothetical protein
MLYYPHFCLDQNLVYNANGPLTVNNGNATYGPFFITIINGSN